MKAPAQADGGGKRGGMFQVEGCLMMFAMQRAWRNGTSAKGVQDGDSVEVSLNKNIKLRPF